MSSPREHDELRARLRDAASEWEPDKTYMINRVAAGRTEAARPRSRAWSLRPVAAAASVAVISVLSVVAVRSVNSAAETHDVPPAAQAPAVVPTSPSPASSPATSSSSSETTKPHTSSPVAGHPATVTASSGIGKNSVATWSECTVTVTNPATVKALSVSIRVALSARAASAGKYTTAPNSDLTFTVTQEADALVYTWVLNKNAQLIPGRYVFAAQFTHTAGRSWSKDEYEVSAGSTDLTGDFG